MFLTPFSGNRLRRRAQSSKPENHPHGIFLPSQRDLRRPKRSGSVQIPCRPFLKIRAFPGPGFPGRIFTVWLGTYQGRMKSQLKMKKRENSLKCRKWAPFPLAKAGAGSGFSPKFPKKSRKIFSPNFFGAFWNTSGKNFLSELLVVGELF